MEKPPGSELNVLHECVPYLRERFARSKVLELSENDLMGIALRVNAIRDHARRVSNVELGLADGQHTIEGKAKALGRFLWRKRSSDGGSVLTVIHWVLYGGPRDDIPSRIWEAVTDPNRRIEHFNVGALGEIVGWALPDDFPPRNGRTSKALRSLGHDVKVQLSTG